MPRLVDINCVLCTDHHPLPPPPLFGAILLKARAVSMHRIYINYMQYKFGGWCKYLMLASGQCIVKQNRFCMSYVFRLKLQSTLTWKVSLSFFYYILYITYVVTRQLHIKSFLWIFFYVSFFFIFFRVLVFRFSLSVFLSTYLSCFQNF